RALDQKHSIDCERSEFVLLKLLFPGYKRGIDTSVLCTRERNVRAEGAFFLLKSETFHSRVELFGKTLQRRRFHAGPEDARGARSRKESNPSDRDGEWHPCQSGDRRFNILDALVRNFADELQGDVYRLGRNPASRVRQRFQLAL